MFEYKDPKFLSVSISNFPYNEIVQSLGVSTGHLTVGDGKELTFVSTNS